MPDSALRCAAVACNTGCVHPEPQHGLSQCQAWHRCRPGGISKCLSQQSARCTFAASFLAHRRAAGAGTGSQVRLSTASTGTSTTSSTQVSWHGPALTRRVVCGHGTRCALPCWLLLLVGVAALPQGAGAAVAMGGGRPICVYRARGRGARGLCPHGVDRPTCIPTSRGRGGGARGLCPHGAGRPMCVPKLLRCVSWLAPGGDVGGLCPHCIGRPVGTESAGRQDWTAGGTARVCY